jgi:hypothetical protein
MKMALRLILGICFVVSTNGRALAADPAAPPAAAPAPTASVVIDTAVHFQTADGADIALASGSYRVESASGGGLRLISASGKSTDLAATAATHDEKLTEPRAILVIGGDDGRRLVLLLPDGKRLEAIGSLSGVRSRAMARQAPALVAPVSPAVAALRAPPAPAPHIEGVVSSGPMARKLFWDRMSGVWGYNVYRNVPVSIVGTFNCSPTLPVPCSAPLATDGTWTLANATPLSPTSPPYCPDNEPLCNLAVIESGRNYESFAETGLQHPGTTYRVTAIYANGQQSSTDVVYNNPATVEVPAGFAAGKPYGGTPGEVWLSWQPVSFAVGYRLFGSGQPATGTPVTGNGVDFKNLAAGTYSWQVTADYGGAYTIVGMPVATFTLP